MMNIYVGNLSYSTNEETLKNAFSQYGEVISAKVINDPMSGASKGFGFVRMNDSEGQIAIDALNNKDLDGRVLKVSVALPRKPRTEGMPSTEGYTRPTIAPRPVATPRPIVASDAMYNSESYNNGYPASPSYSPSFPTGFEEPSNGYNSRQNRRREFKKKDFYRDEDSNSSRRDRTRY